jgi:hypothetical protein
MGTSLSAARGDARLRAFFMNGSLSFLEHVGRITALDTLAARNPRRLDIGVSLRF